MANPVAVTGLACRFPDDGDNVERFWEFICKGRSAYTEHTERFNFHAFHHPKKKLNTSVSKGGHFLKQDVADFDTNFFNISKTEAEGMDPQHRILMEVAFEAMESAGLPMHKIGGTRTGVYVGSFTSDYREMVFRDPETAPMYTGTGTTNASASNRISWFFDLKGPSFTLNTACSSSLVAIHLACQSLQTGESDIAIVGGTSLLLNPDMFMFLSNQGFLAKNGRCKSFDESGDGYGRGDGMAIVILKRADDAIADGDPLRAIIRGTSCNQDGKTKGFTLPSADAQVDLIKEAYQAAGLGFEDTHYVEAHGTGTRAGDGQETEALSRTLGVAHSSHQKLLIGSVKSNIGHLEACAGLAALIKGVYIVEKGLIPPTIHFQNPNPEIPFEKGNLKVPTSLTRWPVNGLRRLSTNSFGYGGTNAHVILDDAYHYLKERNITAAHYTHVLNLQNSTNGILNQPNGVSGSDERRLFALTAANKDGLQRLKESLIAFLKKKSSKLASEYQNAHDYLRDLAYTLCDRRSLLQWKTYAIASSIDDLCNALEREDSDALVSRSARRPRLGFLFTGQGAQWAKMGEELMEYAVFRESVTAADAFLRCNLGASWSAVEELGRDATTSKLQQAEYSQGICTVLQVALVDLLASWNIVPSAVAGHSSGEISAAYCLGAISREDAWTIAFYRGMFSSQLKSFAPELEGAMMAVGASPEVAESYISKAIKGEVVVACVNSPSSVTLSGDLAGIDEISTMLKSEGIFARKLKVDTAYHSTHMNAIAASYLGSLAHIVPKSPSNEPVMYSSVVPGRVDPSDLGAANWVRNLVSPVQFSAAVHDMVRPFLENERSPENAVDVLIEVGPHSALRGPANQTLKAHGITEVTYSSILSRGRDGIESALTCAGDLFAQGVPVDLSAVNRIRSKSATTLPRPLIDLPSYPWNHSLKIWAESRVVKEYRSRQQPRHRLLGSPCPSLHEREKSWRNIIKLTEEPWMHDHKVQGSVLFPGAGFLAMAIEAAREVAEPNRSISSFRLRDVQITAPVVITEEAEFTFQVRPHLIGTREDVSTWWEFNVATSTDNNEPRQNCSGLLMIDYQAGEASAMALERALEARDIKEGYHAAEHSCDTTVAPAKFYEDLSTFGLAYGPTFANLREIRKGHGRSCCTLEIPQDPIEHGTPELRPQIVYPGTLDSIFHVALSASDRQGTMVARAVDEVVVYTDSSRKPGTRLKAYTSPINYGFREAWTDVYTLDDHSMDPAIVMKGVRVAGVSGINTDPDINNSASSPKFCSKLTWKPAVDLLSHNQQQTVLKTLPRPAPNDDVRHSFVRRESAASRHIAKALTSIVHGQVTSPFHDWLRGKNVSTEAEKDTFPVATNRIDTGSEITSNTDIGEDAFDRIETNLENIISGYTNAEDLLDDYELVDRFYSRVPGLAEIRSKFGEYLGLLTHKTPNMSIAEVCLSSYDGHLHPFLPTTGYFHAILQTASYAVCSPDGPALERTRERLESLGENICFETLDHGTEEADLGTGTPKFDVVTAFNIGFAAQNPIDMLEGIKKLLNPGGKLCLIEFTKPGLQISTFENALRKSTPRDSSPLASGNTWENCGLPRPMRVDDFDNPKYQQVSLLVGTVDPTPSEQHASLNGVVLVEAFNPSASAHLLATHLADELASHRIDSERIPWSPDVSGLKDKRCIMLMETDATFLVNLNEQDFKAIQQVVFDAVDIFWISSADTPSGNLVAGLARSIRNEAPGIRFRTLQIDNESHNTPSELASTVARVYQSSTTDHEILIQNCIPMISRIEEDPNVSEEVRRLSPQTTKDVDNVPIGKVSRPQKLTIREPGLLESLCFEADEDPMTDLADDEVEIQVKASGLNFREVMCAMGKIPDNLMGFDASGIVRRVGKAVSKFRIGDRLVLYGHGSHRTVHRSKADFCEIIPDGMSFEEAATLPLVHATAYYGLVHIARVKRGQRILINAAAGGVGQAAIQLANHFGMEIFATVGSEEKRKLVREYGIPNDHIFNSRDLSFAKGVKRMTNDKGVDVILNSFSGEALRQSWYCLAPFGTFLDIAMNWLNNTRLDMLPFSRDAVYCFFNINHIEKDNPELMAEIIKGTFEYLRSGVTKAILPLTTFPVSDVESAFRLLQVGKHLGKVALTYGDEDIVPIVRQPRILELPKDATYLLVGGLGGIGRSVAKLLADHGARNLCFVSRSGATSDNAQQLIRSLEGRNVRVKVLCHDVADEEAITGAIEVCSGDMPPIRGVFQCAMVLRDSLFQRMSYSQWIQSTRPKVQGSWNIHKHLPDVDFSVTLSSFAGVFGSRGQSNYAAAGTYEDALSHFRRSNGQNSVTIDLGIMRDIGVLAEQGITDYLKEWEEPFGMREHEFYSLIKHTLIDQLSGSNRVPPQILTGFATGGSVAAAGISTPFYFDDPRFSILAGTGLGGQNSAGGHEKVVSLEDRVANADSLATATQSVADALVERVAKLMQASSSEVDTQRPLHSYGIDSLAAVDIGNWAFKEIKSNITVFDILSAVPITTLAKNIAIKSSILPKVLLQA